MHDSPLTTHSTRLTTHHSPRLPIVAFVLGTRPEAIKLAPVIRLAGRSGSRLRPVIVSTGQQPHLVGESLGSFGLVCDYDLEVMRPRQSLSRLASRCLAGLGQVLPQIRPHVVVVQGDTTSAMTGAVAALYERVPIAHVEAGLRTGDRAAPFPEEANRQVISRLASIHFAPTINAKTNLLAEGINAASIVVTGNTVVDALKLLAGEIHSAAPPVRVASGQKLVLVTAHRRENLGRPLDAICHALRCLAATRPELHFVFITHPNPVAARTARRLLAGREGITLLPPLAYVESLRLVASSWLIMTDSGGLQEEAPSFGRPVFVLRDSTERTEGIASGAARLVGTDTERIIASVTELADSPEQYAGMILSSNPYGDGKAAGRIVRSLCRFVATAALRRAATVA